MSRYSECPFYRTHPFLSPVDIHDADIRGAYDQGIGVFFNRIAKAANTSIVHTMATVRDGCVPVSNAVKKSFTRPSGMTEEQVASLDQTFKFVFVRRPLERVLSAYLSQVEPGNYDAPCPFDAFVNYLACGGLHANPHWAPQVDLLLLPRFDFVGRVENFDDDMRHVLAHIGAKASPIRRLTVPETRASRHVHTMYTPHSESVVRELYRRDFEEFGYD